MLPDQISDCQTCVSDCAQWSSSSSSSNLPFSYCVLYIALTSCQAQNVSLILNFRHFPNSPVQPVASVGFISLNEVREGAL